MRTCTVCGNPVQLREGPVVTVASDWELNNPHYLRQLKASAAAMNLPRRRWLDALADAIYRFQGNFVFRDGTPYRVPDIDEHFPDDFDHRWISSFAKEVSSDVTPRIRAGSIERVRLFDLYFRIMHPDVASRFTTLVANDNNED